MGKIVCVNKNIHIKKIITVLFIMFINVIVFGCSAIIPNEINNAPDDNLFTINDNDTNNDDKNFIDLTNVKIATGNTYTMVIKTDGSLWVWGENTFGQLGNGTNTKYGGGGKSDGRSDDIIENNDEYIPIKILDNITDVAAGNGFSLAVDNNGTLFSWGYNHNAELGDGTHVNKNIPTKIMENVSCVYANNDAAFAITNDNNLWAWGENKRTRPKKINKNYSINKVIIVSNIIYILDNDNCVYELNKIQPILTDIEDITSGNGVAFALNFNGELYGWGFNSEGGLGIGDSEFYVYPPQKISDDVKTVCPGGMFIKNDDSLWIWGVLHQHIAFRFTESDGHVDNRYGGILIHELGYIANYGNKPVKILENIVAASKKHHCLAVDKNGYLYSWGGNQFGQLGTGKASVIEWINISEDEIEDLIYIFINDNQEANPIIIDNLN